MQRPLHLNNCVKDLILDKWYLIEQLDGGYQGEVYKACKSDTNDCDYVLKIIGDSIGDGFTGEELGFTLKAFQLGIGTKVHHYGKCEDQHGKIICFKF